MTIPEQTASEPAATIETFRPPATPLITHTPYFSVWSFADSLNEDASKHWTGKNHSLLGLIRVDGEAHRFAGRDTVANVQPIPQIALDVQATRTVYSFEGAGVSLKVEFLSPLLMEDRDLLARPVSYVTMTVHSCDGKAHDVELYFEVSAELCVDNAGQAVFASRHRVAGLDTIAFRSADQDVLGRAGDDLRIDWGTLYVSAASGEGLQTAVGSQAPMRKRFIAEGKVPVDDDLRFPRPVQEGWVSASVRYGLGIVGADEVSRHLLIAYDEEFAVEYFGRKLTPYWKRNGADAGQLLSTAAQEYQDVRFRCAEFDAANWASLTAAGGEKYAQLATLAYRQCIAAHTFVEDVDGTLLMFSKENFSNGCMGTVDVTYPGSPFFLHYDPDLLKAQVVPVLDYASMPRWRFPFAPHDLGTYPKSNGQVYGGGERDESDQMPVEECGNMLLLVAAISKRQGSFEWARRYWKVLSTWAEFLMQAGMDPENQLCTDDFAGHMAHNANLSIKAILGIGAYAWMCDQSGETVRARLVRETAQSMAAQWIRMAEEGDHYRLAFDRPGSWSQKYNLGWDRLLDLNLFPEALAREEVAYYLGKLNRYGLPLDNRSDYTKLDWCVWTATLAERREDFDAIVEPMWLWAHETATRVPLTDFFWTIDGKQAAFQARSVVGGVYLPMLSATDFAG